MSDDADQIRIDLKSDISEGEAARKKLAELERQANELKSSFAAGNVTLQRYNQELRNLEGQANRTRAALDKIHPPKLSGTDRAGAMSRAGLLGANTLQDMIQGGPASGINNVLGAANDRGIKALGAEAIAAAGGLGVVSAGFATVVIAAGAAFLAIDHGLKKAKLDWGDLGSVLANTAGWKALEETATGTMAIINEALKDPATAAAVKSLEEGVGKITQAGTGLPGVIWDAAINWDKATDAAKRHKDEVLASAKAAAEYAEAVKQLAGVRSDQQQRASEAGKNNIEQIGRLGGAGGLDAVINRLADQETKHTAKDEHGKDRMVKVPKFNAKGEEDGEEEITRREQARRRIRVEMARVARGDDIARMRMGDSLKGAGYHASLDGLDAKKEAEKAARAEREAIDEPANEARREQEERDRIKKHVEPQARGLQDRFNALTASGNSPDEAGVRRQLERAGAKPEDAKAAAAAVLKDLQEGFNAEIRKRAAEKGLSFPAAAADFLKEHDEKFASDQRQKTHVAVEKGDRATAGTGFNEKAEDALLRASLKAGGNKKLATDDIARQLKREYLRNGMSEEDADRAAHGKAEEVASKTYDDIAKRARDPKPMDPAKAPEHTGVADFARSVESQGAANQAKILTLTEQMREQLITIARNTGGPARMGP